MSDDSSSEVYGVPSMLDIMVLYKNHLQNKKLSFKDWILILEYVKSHKCIEFEFDRNKFSNSSAIIHELENLEWTKVMTALLAVVTNDQNARNDLENNILCNDNNHEDDTIIQ